MLRVCAAVLDLQTPVSSGWEGVGLGRRHVVRYRCPACGGEKRIISSFSRSGATPVLPRGGVVCAGLLPPTAHDGVTP